MELISVERFDLYLLDIWVPEIGGLLSSKNIRATAPTAIVFLSSIDSRPSKNKALSVGGNEFLSKPDDIGKLVSTVDRLLEAASATF